MRHRAKKHHSPSLLPSPSCLSTHTHMQRGRKMCRNVLTYGRREMNRDRADWSSPETSVISDLSANLQGGGNCLCCYFPPCSFLPTILEQGKLLHCKQDIHYNHCWSNAAATRSMEPSRADPQSWRILLPGKTYCDLGRDKEDPRKLHFIFPCFLLVYVIALLCVCREKWN